MQNSSDSLDAFLKMLDEQEDKNIIDVKSVEQSPAVTEEVALEIDIKVYEEASWWQDVSQKGFCICPVKGRYKVYKICTEHDEHICDEITLNTLDDVVLHINKVINTPIPRKVIVTATYNKGFGPEFKEIKIEATSEDDAKNKAKLILDSELGKDNYAFKIRVL